MLSIYLSTHSALDPHCGAATSDPSACPNTMTFGGWWLPLYAGAASHYADTRGGV
jgi:hypothetical protein